MRMYTYSVELKLFPNDGFRNMTACISDMNNERFELIIFAKKKFNFMQSQNEHI